MGFAYLILILVALFLIEFGYLKVARRFHIFDVPNERSSHERQTLRGGGIVIAIAGLAGTWFLPEARWNSAAAVAMVATVSFLDDRYTMPSLVRISAQLIGVGLIAWVYPVMWFVPVLIVGVGFINTYNFMDGINGMHVIYSLFVIIGLYILLPAFQLYFTLIIMGLLVLGWFNCRPQGKAICFSGDVGSVTGGLLILIPLVYLIYENNDLSYILMVSLYGVDSVGTILLRLLRRQNIFVAHRSHLYQLLSNEHGYTHLGVALGYGLLQGALNLFNIYSNFAVPWLWQLIVMAMVYSIFRFVFLKDRVFG